jgi:hypothetical protein
MRVAVAAMAVVVLAGRLASAAPGDPFGGDDAGCYPPSTDAATCQAAVAKALAKATLCLAKCSMKRAAGKLPDTAAESMCEDGDPLKSCRAKYDKATGPASKIDALCPVGLDAAYRVTLYATTRAEFDARTDRIYSCSASPPLACRATLDALGVVWADGPALPGIADPVTVTFPLNGITYQHASSGSPDSGAIMDCRLALALHRMADELHAHGISEVRHFDIYNYRCADPSEFPPDCTPLSPHATGLSIDLGELRGAGGAVYNVLEDWVGNIAIDDPCVGTPATDEDRVLHELVCAWHADSVFDIILTPNYTAAYDNHVHVEVSPGAHFLD